VSQAEVPVHSLVEALRVGRAIADNYAYQPTRPLAVADAMGMKPTTGSFRTLCGASLAYGLTEGGYNAPFISLTEVGRRVFAPTREGDDEAAKRVAVLKPRVFGQFLTRYDGAKLPSDSIAQNVLAELGVPRSIAARTLQLILKSAESVGYLREIRGSIYIDLAGQTPPPATDGADIEDDPTATAYVNVALPSPRSAPSMTPPAGAANRKVFITHGKNKAFVQPIKQLLSFGGFEPIVAVERESVSKPVPDKVMDEMRDCSAAIIHVDAETVIKDEAGKEHVMLNPNVLLEIGAAMALYGRRFILLVSDGIRLPSNLQGLYEVRYGGAVLDSDATIRLMKAIDSFKNTSA
jgi:predicted nucleotide-binding protein